MKYVIILLSVMGLFFVSAKDGLAKGSVKVGDTIPHELNLKDSSGKLRSFSDLRGKKGLVLVFVRSAEWCPFCQKQLIDMNKNENKFNDAGYSVVSVSYDPVDKLQKFSRKNNTKITLLSDPASDSIRAFGILNKANAKGTFSYGIPHPGVYIVSKDKKVQAKFFKAGYQDRPSVDGLLAEIKKLNPPPAPVYESLDNMGQDPIDPEDSVIEIPEKIIDPIIIEEGAEAPALEAAPDEAVLKAVDEVENMAQDGVAQAVEVLEEVKEAAPSPAIPSVEIPSGTPESISEDIIPLEIKEIKPNIPAIEPTEAPAALQ